MHSLWLLPLKLRPPAAPMVEQALLASQVLVGKHGDKIDEGLVIANLKKTTRVKQIETAAT